MLGTAGTNFMGEVSTNSSGTRNRSIRDFSDVTRTTSECVIPIILYLLV